MRLVFVDTSAWVALKHKGDALWQQATTTNRLLVTTGTIPTLRERRVSLTDRP